MTVHPTYQDTQRIIICEGEGFFAAGDTQTMTGVYIDSLATVNNCDSIVITDLIVMPKFESTEIVSICFGETYFAGGDDQAVTGVYRDTFQTIFGCDSVIVTGLVVEPFFDIDIETGICDGDSILLGGAYQYDAGIFVDSLQSSFGCDSIVTTTLFIYDNFDDEFDISICGGDSIFLAGAYQTMGGIYVDSLQSVTGCDSIVTTNLTIIPPTILIASDEEICSGESVELFVQGAETVRWEPSIGLTCSTCPNPVASPDVTTTYTVTATSCAGTQSEIFVTVNVYDPPSIVVTADLEVLKGEETILVAETSDPFATVTWSTGDDVLCTDCEEVAVSPIVGTTYTATAVDDFGCSSEDHVTLIINDDCKFGEFEIPNIISPNGDGANDEFEIRYNGVSDISLLRIYNRWGELVFETDNIENRWDGTFRGQQLNPGVYVYYLEGHCLDDNKFTLTGNITILK